MLNVLRWLRHRDVVQFLFRTATEQIEALCPYIIKSLLAFSLFSLSKGRPEEYSFSFQLPFWPAPSGFLGLLLQPLFFQLWLSSILWGVFSLARLIVWDSLQSCKHVSPFSWGLMQNPVGIPCFNSLYLKPPSWVTCCNMATCRALFWHGPQGWWNCLRLRGGKACSCIGSPSPASQQSHMSLFWATSQASVGCVFCWECK